MNSLPLTLRDCRAIAENHAIALDQELEIVTSENGVPRVQRASWNGHQMEVTSGVDEQASREIIVNVFAEALENAGFADFFLLADEAAAMEHGLTRGRMKQVLDRIDRATLEAVVVDALPSELEPIINNDDPVIAEAVENSPLFYDEILGEYYEPYRASPPTVDAISYQTVDIPPSDLVDYCKEKLTEASQIGREDVAHHWSAAKKEAQAAVHYREQAAQVAQRGNEVLAGQWITMAEEEQMAARCYEKAALATCDGKKERTTKWIIAGWSAKVAVEHGKKVVEALRDENKEETDRALLDARNAREAFSCRKNEALAVEAGKDGLSHCWNQAAQALEKSGRFRTKAAEELLNNKLTDYFDSCFSANAEETRAKYVSNCLIGVAKSWEAVALSKKNEALAMASRGDVTSTSREDDNFVALWKDVADAHEQIADCKNKVVEAALDNDPSSVNFWSELVDKWSMVADEREKNIEAIQHGNREQAAVSARFAADGLERIHQYLRMSGRNLFF